MTLALPWHHRRMSSHPEVPDEVLTTLREAGARFALLFGSHARGEAHEGSDLDIAAYFTEPAPASFEVLLPTGVDLVVLNGASLAITGPVSFEGIPILTDDEPALIEWLAMTRKIYADELPRIRRSIAEYQEAILARGLAQGTFESAKPRRPDHVGELRLRSDDL